MDNRILKCGLVGGLIVFVWCIVSWMFLPWHHRSLNKFKDESKVYQAIKDNAPVSGIYVLPNMYIYRDGASQSDLNREVSSQTQMMQKGPVMFASVCVEGITGSMYMPFIISLIIEVVGAGIITWMLFQTRLTAVEHKIAFVTLAGLLVGVLGLLPSWNWWGFSLSYTLGGMADLVIGWFLAGIAIVKVAKK